MPQKLLLAWLPFALLPAALLPAACAPVSDSRHPPDAPSDDAARPGQASNPVAITCDRAAPSAPLITHLSGPSETATRLVAVTEKHFFVATGRTLRRGTTSSDIERLEAAPAAPIAIIAATPSELFVVTSEGVARSSDEGATFVPANIGLSAPLRAMRASGDTLIATDAAGSVFTWSAASTRWRPVSTGFYASLAVSDGTTILADTGLEVLRSSPTGAWAPARGLEAWGYRDLAIQGHESLAVTSFGELRFSVDGGATFAIASPETLALGTAGNVALGDAFAFAATSSGIARSADLGNTWSLAIDAPGADLTASMAIRGSTMVSSTRDVRLSADGGGHFDAPLELGDASVVSLAEAGPFLFASTADWKIHASSDMGKTWSDVDADGFVIRKGQRDGRSTYLFLSQSLDPTSFGAQALVRSDDEGATFTSLEGPTDAGNSSFGAFAATEGQLFLGSTVDLTSPYDMSSPRGAGVFRSSDGGITWERASDGLPSGENNGVTSYPGVLSLESSNGTLFALLAGESPYLSLDGGDSWKRADGGLPLLVARQIDRLVPQQGGVFASSRAFGAGLYRFSESYLTWQQLAATGLPDGFGVTALHENGGLLFASAESPSGEGRGLYVSSDGGASFVALSLGTPTRSLLVAGDDLFCGTEEEGLFRLSIPKCEPPPQPFTSR